MLGQLSVAATAEGAQALLAWASGHGGVTGSRRVWVIDGTRSHGLGLSRQLAAAGERVLEAPRIKGAARRRGGKSDALDAVHVARAVLAAEHVAAPRADGDREALRLLLVCRRHHTDTRTATVNLFKSLILTADEHLRSRLRHLSTDQQVKTVPTLPTPGPDTDTLTRTRHQQLTDLAAQIATLERILAENLRQLRTLVTAMCPALLDQPGIGPVSAGTALTAWSHPGRLRNEAAFAALAGVNPVPASSGRTIRHRLNRGGDRTLNAALHTIATTRRRCDQAIRDYITRRSAQGLSQKEILRCLKRYIARQIFKIMEATA